MSLNALFVLSCVFLTLNSNSWDWGLLMRIVSTEIFNPFPLSHGPDKNLEVAISPWRKAAIDTSESFLLKPNSKWGRPYVSATAWSERINYHISVNCKTNPKIYLSWNVYKLKFTVPTHKVAYHTKLSKLKSKWKTNNWNWKQQEKQSELDPAFYLF